MIYIRLSNTVTVRTLNCPIFLNVQAPPQAGSVMLPACRPSYFLLLCTVRVDDWFLMSSPWPTVALCVLYYYIIRVAGPRFMKDREPLNIQSLVVVYNLFQTLFSVWIFQKACRFWLTGKD